VIDVPGTLWEIPRQKDAFGNVMVIAVQPSLVPDYLCSYSIWPCTFLPMVGVTV
jgi:hypothetical protein